MALPLAIVAALGFAGCSDDECSDDKDCGPTKVCKGTPKKCVFPKFGWGNESAPSVKDALAKPEDNRGGDTRAPLPAIDLFAPVETAMEPLFFLPGFGQAGDARALVAAPYIVDRIGLGDRTQVWLGARLDAGVRRRGRDPGTPGFSFRRRSGPRPLGR